MELVLTRVIVSSKLLFQLLHYDLWVSKNKIFERQLQMKNYWAVLDPTLHRKVRLSVFTMDDSDFNLYNWRFRFVEARIKIRVICAKMDDWIDACSVVGALHAVPHLSLGHHVMVPKHHSPSQIYVGEALFRTWGKWEK